MNLILNRTPIITTVPSEDHTYSAGGANKRSETSNQTSNGDSTQNVDAPENLVVTNGNDTETNGNHHLSQSDNASNGTSSDAAYESSEER